jgi:hypothetical protein
MTFKNVCDCQIRQITTYPDQRGILGVIQEDGLLLDFPIKRIYYLYDVPSGVQRAAHAHKNLHQFFIAMSGSFNVDIDDGNERSRFFLNSPSKGLYVPPGLWRDVCDFSSGSTCLVLASELFSEEDYIRDYQQFIIYRSKGEVL